MELKTIKISDIIYSDNGVTLVLDADQIHKVMSKLSEYIGGYDSENCKIKELIDFDKMDFETVTKYLRRSSYLQEYRELSTLKFKYFYDQLQDIRDNMHIFYQYNPATYNFNSIDNQIALVANEIFGCRDQLDISRHNEELSDIKYTVKWITKGMDAILRYRERNKYVLKEPLYQYVDFEKQLLNICMKVLESIVLETY